MQNPYVALLITAWKYAREQKGRYVFVYSLFILANVIGAMHPLLFGWFVNQISQKGADIPMIALKYGGGFMGLKLAEWCLHGPSRVMERELAFTVSRNFLQELYHQTLHLPVKWHKEHHSGATINRIRKAYEALKAFFQTGFAYMHTIFKCVFSFGAMLYFSPLFGTVGVLLGAFTVWVILKFDKPFIKSVDETNEREHESSSMLFDSLSNIITVITLRLEKQMEVGMLGKIMNVFPPFQRNIRINEWKWFVASMLIALVYVTVTLGYVSQHYTPGQAFAVGGLVTLLGYVNQFTSVFSDVAFQYTQIVQYNTDVQTARGIGKAYADYHRPEGTLELPADWKSIEIEGLNFAHSRTFGFGENKKAPSLTDLSVRIERGKRIALIGESGSGKSTLLTLLRGLYNPESVNSLKVDGQHLGNLGLLSNTVTLFPQEPEIFENTVEYNITLGLPFGDEEVLRACDTSRFADIVKFLPEGLDTAIQEKGVNLSGGQKQRLALARGVLAARDSNIVLLDEPTSSVDPKTEFEIYHKMLSEFSDKAVISTLHRLHLLPMFDYIYILRNGRVVDEGSFIELRSRSLIFQEMWSHQQETTKDYVAA